MSKNFRNQRADGTFDDSNSELMNALVDVLPGTTMELEDAPWPPAGKYLITVMEIVEDAVNKCVRLRCNIDKGSSKLQGRNFITTLWFNSEAAVKWSMRTILRACTGERFPKGQFSLGHVLTMLHTMENQSFVLERTIKQGETRTFVNDTLLSKDEAASEKNVDEVAAKLASK